MIIFRPSDTKIVKGLREHDSSMERYFFKLCHGYFNRCFDKMFFDPDSRDEIFQNAFVKLWTEIENGTIRDIDGRVCRRSSDGLFRPMTASLTTFLIAFARTEFRELLRDSHTVSIEDTPDAAAVCIDPSDTDQRIAVIDDCIRSLSPSCIEIITLFYYQQKSLDEILAIRGANTSKDGLKTAKNKCMNTLRERVNRRLYG